MRYLILASDYDGTIAHDGLVDEATIESLRRLRQSGRWLVLLTGRRLPELLNIFPGVTVFHRVIAENGALMYDPATKEEVLLAPAPPPELIAALKARRIEPLDVGHVILATWQPHETAVLETIRDLGLESQVIFNKGAVMIVPPGINKASGLEKALKALALSRHNAVGIGDAENDHALLRSCECAVAVANALPALKEAADLVTAGENGDGSRDLAERLLASDLAELAPRLTRHWVLVGTRADGTEMRLDPYGPCLLVAGASGSGKSTFATSFMEQLATAGYQSCIIDPEGDYSSREDAIVLGNNDNPPAMEEILDVLKAPDQHVVVNLLGIALNDRPAFFAALLPRLQEMRARLGRPHWIVIDEAHHLMPREWSAAGLTLPSELPSTLLITVHPEHLAPAALASINAAVTVGPGAAEVLAAVAKARGAEPPPAPTAPLSPGEVLCWFPGTGEPPTVVRVPASRQTRRRHVRKYAGGELAEDKSFFFRGPESKLNLRAQNLALFTQLADGVDDATWQHHLKLGDYSRWIRGSIKDSELADEVAEIESNAGGDQDSRARVRAAIERRYTLAP